MTAAISDSSSEPQKLTIREIKDEIRRRALERQGQIERGEYDVPVHYAPLSVTELYDLLGQVEYRRDFLELAVPPWEPSLGARLKHFCKKMICTALRWLLIRQVEFNTLALAHARESSRLLALADQNLGEFIASLSALKLQMNALAQRIGRLEAGPVCDSHAPDSSADAIPAASKGLEDARAAFSVYLSYLCEPGTAIVLGCERGDLLRFMISEGIQAQGVEADPALAEYCQERELPVVRGEAIEYLSGLEEGSVAGIVLRQTLSCLAPRELAELLGQCWLKLKKGATVIIVADNAQCVLHGSLDRPRLPAELLSFLCESQSFTVEDFIFSRPINAGVEAVAQRRAAKPFDSKLYRDYAVVGRK